MGVTIDFTPQIWGVRLPLKDVPNFGEMLFPFKIKYLKLTASVLNQSLMKK